MLEELLHEIRSGGTTQPAVLADRLDTSVAMVQAMLEQLERLGLLYPVAQDCGDSCGGCPLADSCKSPLGAKSRLWMLR